MPISALVLHLDEAPGARDATVARLAALPYLTLGEPAGARLPAALETSSAADDEAAWTAILDVPGVRLVDVVAAFDPDALDLAPHAE